MERAVLYSYWRSSSSYRVRIVLNLKKVDYEYRPINLLKLSQGEQPPAEFLRLNPGGQVPTLLIDGHVLTQSVAICEYLEEAVTGGVKLLPEDPAQRAQVRRVVEIVNSGIQPLHNSAVLDYLSSKFGDAARTEWSKHWIHKGLIQLETILQHSVGQGPYSFGKQLTLADAFLVPQIGHAERFGVNMEEFPLLRKIYHTLIELPEFAAAHPSRQPDAEEHLA
jgi:maleylacetoacetate isomerase